MKSAITRYGSPTKTLAKDHSRDISNLTSTASKIPHTIFFSATAYPLYGEDSNMYIIKHKLLKFKNDLVVHFFYSANTSALNIFLNQLTKPVTVFVSSSDHLFTISQLCADNFSVHIAHIREKNMKLKEHKQYHRFHHREVKLNSYSALFLTKSSLDPQPIARKTSENKKPIRSNISDRNENCPESSRFKIDLFF